MNWSRSRQRAKAPCPGQGLNGSLHFKYNKSRALIMDATAQTAVSVSIKEAATEEPIVFLHCSAGNNGPWRATAKPGPGPIA